MADETRDALIKLAQAVDRLAFATAGLAAYIAHLPEADAVDLPAVKETARDFIPEPVYRGFEEFAPPRYREPQRRVYWYEAPPRRAYRDDNWRRY